MKKTKIHIDKIYTKAGDKGKTLIIGKKELVSKASDRVEAYGSIDELMSHLGLTISFLIEYREDFSDIISWEKTFSWLVRIQNNLFDLGSLIATVPYIEQDNSLKKFPENRVKFLEEAIDSIAPKLPALDSFVLPGGHILNSQLHICRTICRKAERRLVKLQENEEVLQKKVIMQYINRLSDLLFALSRWVSFELKEKEVLWKPGE